MDTYDDREKIFCKKKISEKFDMYVWICRKPTQ